MRYILGNNYVSARGNSRDQKSKQSRLGFVLQIQTRADVKDVLLAAETPLFQYDDHADPELCHWNLDIIIGTRKNDTIDSMIRSIQLKMLRLIIQTQRKYKKKTQTNKNEENGEEENANHRDSDDETAEGSSTTTDCDQDSDVSFMKDSDEEIDTAEIEEEEWIETHRRMKWRLAMRIAFQTSDGQRKQQNGTQVSAPSTKQTNQWGDRKRHGKMRLTNSSNLMKLKRQKEMK